MVRPTEGGGRGWRQWKESRARARRQRARRGGRDEQQPAEPAKLRRGVACPRQRGQRRWSGRVGAAPTSITRAGAREVRWLWPRAAARGPVRLHGAHQLNRSDAVRAAVVRVSEQLAAVMQKRTLRWFCYRKAARDRGPRIGRLLEGQGWSAGGAASGAW